MPDAPEPMLVVLDNRKRAPLGKLATETHYLAHREASGRIVLEPAAILTRAELALRDDERFWARVARALDEPTERIEPDEL
jgi:hypothetical protein